MISILRGAVSEVINDRTFQNKLKHRKIIRLL